MSPLDKEACEVLNKYVLDKVNGVGLNRVITQELVTLSRLAGLSSPQGRNNHLMGYLPGSIRRASGAVHKSLSHERLLNDSHILTGWRQ
jgi:hypothetical protein